MVPSSHFSHTRPHKETSSTNRCTSTAAKSYHQIQGQVRGQRACQGVSFRLQLPQSSRLCPDYDRLIQARAAGTSNGIQNACLLHRTSSRSFSRETLVIDPASSRRGTVRTRNQSFLVRNFFVTAEQYSINRKIHDG